jgi:hypothetical protein
MKKRECYIDENGVFQFNQDDMLLWFEDAMVQLEKAKPLEEQIPFMVFLMGCEASLRCQEKNTIH